MKCLVEGQTNLSWTFSLKIYPKADDIDEWLSVCDVRWYVPSYKTVVYIIWHHLKSRDISQLEQ